MTTVDSENIHNIAVNGSFDDCQNLVKTLFGDEPFRRDMNLCAVNSINWGRVLAQIVYYVYAALALGTRERPVIFSVPSGNFGNIFAGYAAAKIGAPIQALMAGSNENDTLTRFFQTGILESRTPVKTIAPSMDIQIPSNLERLLSELYRDAKTLSEDMVRVKDGEALRIKTEFWKEACTLFHSARRNEDETRKTIRHWYEQTGEILDPHTAIGVSAAEEMVKAFPDHPVIAVSTAHPVKFASVIEDTLGRGPDEPESVRSLRGKKERCVDMDNDPQKLKTFIRTI